MYNMIFIKFRSKQNRVKQNHSLGSHVFTKACLTCSSQAGEGRVEIFGKGDLSHSHVVQMTLPLNTGLPWRMKLSLSQGDGGATILAFLYKSGKGVGSSLHGMEST